MWRKDGHLAFEAKNRTVDIGLSGEYARIIQEETGGKVVGAIQDQIVVRDNLHNIL